MFVSGRNPKTALTVEIGDPPGDVDGDRVERRDRPRVEEDVGLLRVEADGQDVEEVLVPPARGVRPGELRPRPYLLVVGDLDVHLRAEPFLEPLAEVELHQVGTVERAGRSPARVEEERLALLVLVEDPTEVPVGVVDPPGDQRVDASPREPTEPLDQRSVELLGAEQLPEARVVDPPLDLVRGDGERLVRGHRTVRALSLPGR